MVNPTSTRLGRRRPREEEVRFGLDNLHSSFMRQAIVALKFERDGEGKSNVFRSPCLFPPLCLPISFYIIVIIVIIVIIGIITVFYFIYTSSTNFFLVWTNIVLVTAAVEMRGNGFFIEVPGQNNNIILTARHNLVDSHGMSSTDLMAWWQDGDEWISIATENVRVSKAYLARPTEQSATDDFGIIILKSENVKQRRQAFVFSMRLGEDDRIDGQCNISSYSAKSFLMDGPTQSTGRFVNPIIAENQLEYLVGTSAGMSGSVVWVGCNGSPTAVAIQYGPTLTPGRRSRHSLD